MELKKRPVKFLKQEDLIPVNMERLTRHYDEVNSTANASITALEARITALEARVTTLEAP